MADQLLALDDTSRAREIYLAATPGWLDPQQWPELISLYPFNGCMVSWILINTGDEDLGHRLLDQSTSFIVENITKVDEHADRGLFYAPDICYLTAGDTENALLAIETYLEHNHLFGWQVYHQLPMFDLIRHEPRYQAALAERNRRIEEQREAMKKAGLL